MPDAIEEVIRVSAMYGLTTIGNVAKFTGAVLRGDKTAARKLWCGELHKVADHIDDIFNQEIELWLQSQSC